MVYIGTDSVLCNWYLSRDWPGLIDKQWTIENSFLAVNPTLEVRALTIAINEISGIHSVGSLKKGLFENNLLLLHEQNP